MNTIDQASPPDPSGVSFWPLVLRYGAVWGGVSILSSLIGYVTNTDGSTADPGPVKWIYTLVGLAVAAWAVATAIRIDRDEQLGGYIGLGRCLGLGASTGALAGAIGAVFTIFYMTIINPGFSEQLKETMIAQWEEQGMGEEEIEMALSMSSAITNPFMLSIWQTIGSALLGLIIGLVAGLILKRERQMF